MRHIRGPESGRHVAALAAWQAGCRSLCFFLLLSIMSVGASASAGQRPDRARLATTVAVLSFTNRDPGDGWDWLEGGLADMLITDLAKAERLCLIERERIAMIQRELKIPPRSMLEGGAARCGRALAVSRVVCGSFAIVANNAELQACIVDVRSGRLARVDTVQGRSAEILRLQKQLAEKVIARMGTPLTDEERKALWRFSTTNLSAARCFHEGTAAMDGGDPRAALSRYRLAAKADPDYVRARLAIGDTYEALEEHEHARLAYRQVASASPQSPEAAEALYCLARVCRSLEGKAEEALEALATLRTSHPGRRLVAPGFTPFTRVRVLSTAELTWLEAGDILASLGRYEQAVQAYDQVIANDPPFESFGLTGYQRGVPSRDARLPSAARHQKDQLIRDVYEKHGCLPPSSRDVVILSQERPAYAEDYTTDKRFRDGWRIESHKETTREEAEKLMRPGSARSRSGFVRASAEGPAFVIGVTDSYRFAAPKGCAFRSLKISVDGEAGKSEWSRFGACVRHGLTNVPIQIVECRETDRRTFSKTVSLPPGTGFVVIELRPPRSRIYSWQVEAEIEKLEPSGRLTVKSSLPYARALLDGLYVGRTPCTIPNVPAGSHTVECLWGETRICDAHLRIHQDDPLPQFGIQAGRHVVSVEPNQERVADVQLQLKGETKTFWEPAHRLFAKCRTRGRGKNFDLAVGRDAVVAVCTDGRDLWIASRTNKSSWRAAAKLSAPVGGAAAELAPRVVQLPDGRWLLAWVVNYLGFRKISVSVSPDLGQWPAPATIFATEERLEDIALVLDHRGSPALFWLVRKERGSRSGTQDGVYRCDPLGDVDPGFMGAPQFVTRLAEQIGFDSSGAAVLAAGCWTHVPEKDPRTGRPLMAMKLRIYRAEPGGTFGPVGSDWQLPLHLGVVHSLRAKRDGTILIGAQASYRAPEDRFPCTFASRDAVNWSPALKLPYLKSPFSLSESGTGDMWILWRHGSTLWVSRLPAGLKARSGASSEDRGR